MSDSISIRAAGFIGFRRDERDVWQVARRRLPAWVKDRKSPGGYLRPTAVLCAGRETGVEMVPSDRRGQLPPDALEQVIRKTAALRNTMPARIEVLSEADATAIRPLVEPAGVIVEVKPQLAALDAIVNEMEIALNHGVACPIPPLMHTPGITLARVRAFADAAALFAAARPWNWTDDESLFRIDRPIIDDPALSYCVAMGQLGECVGLSFYAGPEQIHAMTAGPKKFWKKNTDLIWVIWLDDICNLPLADADLWIDHDLPVAGKSLYPLPHGTRDGRSFVRPGPAVLTAMEAVLRAYAAGARREARSGAWSRRVETFAGPQTVSMHAVDPPLDVMDAEDPDRADGPVGIMIPTGYGSPFDSCAAESAMFGMIREKGLAGPVQDDAFLRAQQLCYDAMEAGTNRQRARLCRRALEIDPDCCDAIAMLAEIQSTSEKEYIRRLRHAVDAGERSLGSEAFTQLTDEFWQTLETRPYMRARALLADALQMAGLVDEAASHWRAMLDLNPNDNQGSRYRLLPVLLHQQRLDAAEKLWRRYSEDASAWWTWGRLLLCLLTDDRQAAAAAMADARSSNPLVEDLLLARRQFPRCLPDFYTPGEDSEAVAAVAALLPAWAAAPEALNWLRDQPPASLTLPMSDQVRSLAGGPSRKFKRSKRRSR